MTVRNRPAALLGMAMLFIGIAILVSASRITSGFGYDAVGPRAFPMIIGAGFILSAVLIVVESIKFAPEPTGEGPLNLWPVAMISVALLLEAFLIRFAGWVPMATLMFMAGARAFGERRFLVNFTLGLGLAVVVLVAFNFGLGLELPLGVLAPLFPAN